MMRRVDSLLPIHMNFRSGSLSYPVAFPARICSVTWIDRISFW
jgi:hypothetical protein